MIVLGKFGITASSVIAVIGSVGLSVGLALQGTLSNFAGGVLILILKPLRKVEITSGKILTERRNCFRDPALLYETADRR